MGLKKMNTLDNKPQNPRFCYPHKTITDKCLFNSLFFPLPKNKIEKRK